MKKELIGHVGVDSGQLLLCDPCYIDSEWKKEDFEDVRIYRHKTTGDILQYMKDFANYEQIIPKYGKTMNELAFTGEWEEVEDKTSSAYPFSYNACCKHTVSPKGHGQLDFNTGVPGVGVAFSTAIGDGLYPVYANYDADGNLTSVEVMF